MNENALRSQLINYISSLTIGKKACFHTRHNFVAKGAVIGYGANGETILQDEDGGLILIEREAIQSIRVDPNDLPLELRSKVVFG